MTHSPDVEPMESPVVQSCSACRKLKRKCDKALPKCGLCSRTRRTCVYTPSTSPAPSAAEFAAIQARLEELEERLSSSVHLARHSQDSTPGSAYPESGPSGPSTQGHNPSIAERFPAALFLDIDYYMWSGMRLPKPSVEIPINILALLTQGNIVTEIFQDYVNTIHLWMPIVSKKRMDTGVAVHNAGPDLAMLFLAMRLITSAPDADATHSLYAMAKSFLAALDAAGFVSQRCLQALLLVALYEYSQAIYPAAWMTVGACARYVELLGISCSVAKANFMRPCTTWTEIEERRRLWWGVFILDRLICLGSRRPFALPEPPVDGLLPVDENAWDEGDTARCQPRAISIITTADDSSFAQLCIAATFVDSAMKFRWNTHLSDSLTIGAVDLIDRMCKHISFVDGCASNQTSTDMSWITPQASMRSALFLVLDAFTCPEKLSDQPGYIVCAGGKSSEELGLLGRATVLTQEVAEQSHMLAMKAFQFFENDPSTFSNLGRISPCTLDAIYYSLASYHWYYGEQGNEAYKSKIRDLELYLERLGTRWKLGREYLSLARHNDAIDRSRLISEL